MRSFRSAASLILAAPDPVTPNCINILSLKRSASSTHFPNFHVFPGGNFDDADSSPDWLSILSQKALLVPLRITGQQSEAVGPVPESISLRITAIRETFEETGILLCRSIQDIRQSNLMNHLQPRDVDIWRRKIHDNAGKFLDLCRTCNCVPDIESLYFLSNWITPENYKRRYDCKFFIAVVDQQLDGVADQNEIESMEWNTMTYFLSSEHILFPPPQIYETYKLKEFRSINALREFAFELNQRECERFIPVSVNANDGVIIILPGDEKYVETYTLGSEEFLEINCNMSEYRGDVMHRIELQNGKRRKHVNPRVISETFNHCRHIFEGTGRSMERPLQKISHENAALWRNLPHKNQFWRFLEETF